jgi:hypothetical protein
VPSSILRAYCAALLLCAWAAPAVAADRYGEFHLGTTRVELPGFPGVADRVEGAYGIGVGAKFNEYFSTQLDWHTLGENRNVAAPPPCPTPPCTLVLILPSPEHGYALRALPRLPLGERFALELGIGWMKWEGDHTNAGTVFSDSGTDPFYSFGVEWKFGEQWSATVEYQRLEHDYLDFDWTGATVRYRF